MTELKRPHLYYKELLKKNEERLNDALHLTVTYDDLLERIKDSLRSSDSSLQEENKEVFEGILHGEATSAIERLLEIAPISGDLYSFRHDVPIGRNIILESASSLGEIHSGNDRESATIELKDVQHFLTAYNGIKLYRGAKRIGFLGNKESDWVRLQQYRTKGQQFYRFDLGNIVGFVSVSDAAQKNIEEISSRLDISQNDTSIIFKFLVEFVFNELFYELNKKANELIKVILDEEGVTSKPLSRQVSEDKDALRRLFEKNTELQTESDKLRWIIERADDRHGDEIFSQEHLLDKVTAIKGGLISEQKMHRIIKKSFDKIDEQLNQINIESYNNYKLMANGLVTESIVHQLDAIMRVSLPRDYKEHTECLKHYFRETNNFKFYTTHVSPIKDGLDVIESSFDKIAALHVLLEGSFVHKGGQDDFVNQDVGAAASEVWNGLLRGRSIRDIELSVKLDGLSWRVPKGTLNHVFYNLFDNSIYWIRRDAFNGASGCADAIVTVQKGEDGEVLVFDSGPGIDRSMEDILFAPLESSKPRSERRGMGLYVVKMLLNSYGADIVLLEERNAKGNRYIFQINPAEARES